MISVNRIFGRLGDWLNLLTAIKVAETSVRRATSGARVNSVTENSAVMTVVSKMDRQITGISTPIKNTLDDVFMFDTASACLQTT